jgi:putative ABC transport system permease protein
VAQGRADLERVGRSIAETNPMNQTVLPKVAAMRDFVVGDVRPMLLVLMGAVVFVLLVAVANVANLALARGTARRKEMAVRAALGASRLRIVRQMLVESCVVALAGGVLGVLLALWGVDVLASLRPKAIPEAIALHVDLGVLAFSFGVSVVAGVLFGVLPAVQAAGTDLGEVLKDSDQRTATGGKRQGRTRNALVVAEVALALVLLVGAGLSVRGFVGLMRVDPGFAADGLLTMSVTLPTSSYDTPEKIVGYRERLRDAMAAIPGVAAATLSSGLPLTGPSESSYGVDGEPPLRPGETHFAVYFPVDGAYREALGLRLIAGRFIEDSDRAGAPYVMVVDEHMARTVLAGKDPIGQRIKFGDDIAEVVGVVGHVVTYGLGADEPAADQMYVSWRQIAPVWFVPTNRNVQITLRAQPDVAPASLSATAAAAAAAIDPDQPVYEVQTMHQLLDDSVGARRFAMLLLGVFAAVGLALAVVGLYSVMSYLVEQRRHEVGVRMALGARPRDVERLVVGHGLRLTAIGLVIGVAGSFALAGVMSSILYGVRPTDPFTFVVVAAIVTAAATLATWLPARRAARVDPMTALRAD